MLYPDSYFAQIIFSATSWTLGLSKGRGTLTALISHHRRRIPSQHAQSSNPKHFGPKPFRSIILSRAKRYSRHLTPRHAHALHERRAMETSIITVYHVSFHGHTSRMDMDGWIDRTQDNPCDASCGPTLLMLVGSVTMSHGWMGWIMLCPSLSHCHAGPNES